MLFLMVLLAEPALHLALVIVAADETQHAVMLSVFDQKSQAE